MVRVLTFLSGDLPESEFLKLATPETSAGKRCEALYYSGVMRVITGNKSEGAEQLRKCVAVGHKSYYEHWYAAAELNALKAEK